MWFHRRCEICGLAFTTHVPNKKWCSDPCKALGTKLYQEKYRAAEKGAQSKAYHDILNDIFEPFTSKNNLVLNVTRARALGMSYGYYMAHKEGRI